MLARVKPVLNRQPRGFSITVIYWVLYSVIFTVTELRPGASLVLTETYRAVLHRSRYLASDEGSVRLWLRVVTATLEDLRPFEQGLLPLMDHRRVITEPARQIRNRLLPLQDFKGNPRLEL
jgi:hypothetical protein